MSNKFKPYDFVEIKDSNPVKSGIIQKCYKNSALVSSVEDNDRKKYPYSSLMKVKKKLLSEDKLKKFIRSEISFSELTDGLEVLNYFYVDNLYQVTLEDLLTTLRKSVSDFDETRINLYTWISMLEYLDYEYIEIEDYSASDFYLTGIPDEVDMKIELWYELIENINSEDYDLAIVNKLINEVERFIETKEKDLSERYYTESQKEQFIKFWQDDEKLKTANEETLRAFRYFCDELSEKDNKVALSAKGYSCYGGNEAYECDWDIACKHMLKLIELTGSPIFANTLGYIYYYGRCNNGVPDYEKAFWYFSIGAAGGLYESIYKQADMFSNGYAVVKNKEIALNIISGLYSENIKYLLSGKFNTKVADIALRYGLLEEEVNKSLKEAYCYYLQAKYAIERRMDIIDYYGDKVVESKINQKINEIKPKVVFKITDNKSEFDNIFRVLRYNLNQGDKFVLNVKEKGRSGNYDLTFKALRSNGLKSFKKLFAVIEECEFCGLLDELKVTIKKVKKLKLKTDGAIIFNKISDNNFYLDDKLVATINGVYYFDSTNSNKEYQFVSVYLEDLERNLEYRCDIKGIQIDNLVFVPDFKTSGIVTKIYKKSIIELEEMLKDYKKITKKIR